MWWDQTGPRQSPGDHPRRRSSTITNNKHCIATCEYDEYFEYLLWTLLDSACLKSNLLLLTVWLCVAGCCEVWAHLQCRLCAGTSRKHIALRIAAFWCRDLWQTVSSYVKWRGCGCEEILWWRAGVARWTTVNSGPTTAGCWWHHHLASLLSAHFIVRTFRMTVTLLLVSHLVFAAKHLKILLLKDNVNVYRNEQLKVYYLFLRTTAQFF